MFIKLVLVMRVHLILLFKVNVHILFNINTVLKKVWEAARSVSWYFILTSWFYIACFVIWLLICYSSNLFCKYSLAYQTPPLLSFHRKAFDNHRSMN